MVTIRDSVRFSLGKVTLDALTAYARAEGWAKSGTFWKYSDIYTDDGKPRIIIPRTDAIDDYELAVEDLIVAFSKVSGRDEDSIYRELAAADCDGLRFRAVEASPDRQVAERLSEALRYARSAITKTELGDKGAFEGADKHGVNSNLCEALADLAEGVSSFDISFRWAITRPSKRSSGPIAFSDGDALILREAARMIGAVHPHPSPPPSRGRGRCGARTV